MATGELLLQKYGGIGLIGFIFWKWIPICKYKYKIEQKIMGAV